MNEMRKLMEAVERAQSGRRVAESEMQTYNVEYTVTVNVPVDAANQDEAEEKFFDYLFSNELQMDHNFGLDLGEVAITESEMQTYDVEYTVTVNVPVDAANQDEAEEKFFDYLFENELQMDHNFGLDLGEVTITPQSGGRRVAESQPDPTVAEQKLDDLKIEFAQTLMAISGFYSSDDPHSMFRNEMEQFEADVSELLDKMGFFRDSEDLAEVDQMETDGFEVGDLVRIVGNSWDSLEDELEEYQSRKYQGKVGRVKFPKARKGRRRGVSVEFGWNSILANPEDLELVKKADDKQQ